MIQGLTKTVLEQAYTYTAYRAMTRALLAEGKTTGPNQSEDMVHYTKMNETRMKRLDKKTELTEDSRVRLAAYTQPTIWLILTEPWCGDAAQIIPVLEKLAAENPHLSTRYVLRDEHLELMDAFLTNGGRAIPKVLAVNPEDLSVRADWGPRPKGAQVLMDGFKAQRAADPESVDFEMIKTSLQKWYNEDATVQVQAEALDALLA